MARSRKQVHPKKFDPKFKRRVYVRNRSSLSHVQKPIYEQLDRYSVKHFDDPQRSFPAPQPLLVELGFGDGRLLWQFAQRYPYWNCLGVDVYKPGIATLIKKCLEFDLQNVRIVQEEGLTVLEQLPDRTIDKLWVLFPDPWPKKRHHKRRLVTDEFVEVAAAKLKVNCRIDLATDWDDYAEEMIECFARNKLFYGDRIPRPNARPISKYERRGKEEGHRMHYLRYMRLSEEIDLPHNPNDGSRTRSRRDGPVALLSPPLKRIP